MRGGRAQGSSGGEGEGGGKQGGGSGRGGHNLTHRTIMHHQHHCHRTRASSILPPPRPWCGRQQRPMFEVIRASCVEIVLACLPTSPRSLGRTWRSRKTPHKTRSAANRTKEMMQPCCPLYLVCHLFDCAIAFSKTRSFADRANFHREAAP